MSWCQTTKKQPSRDGMYLVNILAQSLNAEQPSDPIMLVAMFAEGKWSVPDEWKESVSHWRYLPSPPKMESLVRVAGAT